jgi:hypothetical protein
MLVMANARREPRERADTRIVAHWEDQAGVRRISHGRLENMSGSGLCIRVNDPIGVGSKLDVHTPKFGNFSCIVVRAYQDGEGYVLGLKKEKPPEPTAGRWLNHEK